MPMTTFDASVPVFVRGLTVVKGLLAKAEDHARAAGMERAALVGARLAPDMLTLAGQVQRASDTAKLSVARLTSQSFPAFPDDEASLEALEARVTKTIDLLTGLSADLFSGSEELEITIGGEASKRVFVGIDYLLGFALPNFYFHVTTTYAILRHEGVQLGKRDFLGDAGKIGVGGPSVR